MQYQLRHLAYGSCCYSAQPYHIFTEYHFSLLLLCLDIAPSSRKFNRDHSYSNTYASITPFEQ